MNIIIGGALAFLITFYAIPEIIQLAHRKKLYDIPDERKIHKAPIPRLGGLAMFMGLLVSLLLMAIITPQNAFQPYVISLLLIFFLGCQDDLLTMSPSKKFIGQLIAAAVLVFKGKLLITGMHGFLGLQEMNPIVSHIFTLFTIILVINAFNLIDGIDGLAGGIGLVTSIVFGIYFFINDDIAHALLAFTLAGSIAGFLVFNFHPARIFMGDTGSMLLGLVNAILVIRFIEMAPAYGRFPLHASPAIGFGVLLIPLMDTLRVFSIRMLHRRSPFSPDRNHLHHILLDKGFSHKTIALSIALGTIACSIIAFTTAAFGTTLSILSLISLFFAGIYALTLIKPAQKPTTISIKAEEPVQKDKSTKLVPLYHFQEEAAAVEEV